MGIRTVYAHYTPSAMSDDRVWFDAANDIDRVLAHVRYASQSDADDLPPTQSDLTPGAASRVRLGG